MMKHSHTKTRIGLHNLYSSKQKIWCVITTYYGHHDKNSSYNYAYKIEHKPTKIIEDV